MEITPATDLHHLNGRLNIIAMSIVHQMCQRRERMIQRFCGCDSPLLVDRQHSLQQVDEFPPVRLFGQQLSALQIRWHIHLTNVVDAVEDVLPSLLALRSRLTLVLVRRFQSPERIRCVYVPIKELGRLAGTVQHMLCR